MQNDPYFKKEIEYNLHRRSFKFAVAHDIFSTFQVDQGSDLLLDTLLRRSPVDPDPKAVLDIGCGYGTLGIVIAKNFPETDVFMVDRDMLSLRYAEYNSKLNGVSEQTTLIGSVGIDNVERTDFDLIVSNIPAKIGDDAILSEFIYKPIELLSQGGNYYIVVKTALSRVIKRAYSERELYFSQLSKRSGHLVYRYSK